MYYKLINQDRTTRRGCDNETSWPVGRWHEAIGDPERGLCSDGWLHCYPDPYLALFLNPIHADIANPIVCEVEVDGKGESDNGLKYGFRRMRAVKDLDIPQPTTEQRIRFGILCALAVYDGSEFTQWAKDWLSGKDRTARAAAEAALVARAVWAAEAALVAWAAWAAAGAAAGVARAVWAAGAAAGAAVEAAAETAALAAAGAAQAAGAADIDLIGLAHKAMED